MLDILIVEDDQPSWEILTHRLKPMDFTIHVAQSAEIAQQLMNNSAYRLVVIDLSLPGMDGWNLLYWIQNQFPENPPKAVAITAYYDPGVALKAREAGFIQCYPKPATQAVVEEMTALILTA